jgi:hypothetical protein
MLGWMIVNSAALLGDPALVGSASDFSGLIDE